MAVIFAQGNESKGFSGEVLIKTDVASSPFTSALPAETVNVAYMDNNGYPIIIDNNSMMINKIPGAVLGAVTIDGYIKNDRGFHTLITTAFGPRTGGRLTPWLMSLVDYSGQTAINYAAVFWNTLSLSGQFDQRGTGLGWRFRLQGVTLDLNNTLGATAITAPGTSGTDGTGISTFGNTTYSNGATDSPTPYTDIQSVRLDLNNQGDIVPAFAASGNRLVKGWVPGPITGTLGLTQINGSANALPQATGDYPLNIAIPDAQGESPSTLTLALSLSWDQSTKQNAGRDFNKFSHAFTIFSTNAGNATGTAGTPWPIIATYA